MPDSTPAMNDASQQPPIRQRANELNFILTGGLTTLANRLASPQVVLPWVYHMIGGPVLLIGILIPSVRLGALLAQLTVVPALLARKVRKWAYVVASLLVAFLLLLICLVALEFSAMTAVTVFFLSTLGLGACNGVIMLSSQEVMAKSVERERIGKLLAIQASLGGLLTLLLVAGMMYIYPDDGTKGQHLILVVIAAGVTAIAGLVFAGVHEPASVVQKRRSVWAETRRGWELYRTTPWFRNFFRTRALLLSVGLATPFYSIHAASEQQSGSQALSIFVLATGVTNMLSGFVWSRMLTRDPTQVMMWAGVLAAVAGGVAMIRASFPVLPIAVMYIFVFSLLELAVQGLSQSSKAYLALMTPDDDRPLYLAISNALLGVLAVVVSLLIGFVAHSAHIYAALAMLMVMGLVAARSARGLQAPLLNKR